MSKTLHLIGTCHVDPDGAYKLHVILKQIEPDVIAVEYLDRGTRDNRRINFNYTEILSAIRSQIIDMTESQFGFTQRFIKEIGLCLGYEITTVENYAKDHDIYVHCIDKDCLDNNTLNDTLKNTLVELYVYLFKEYAKMNININHDEEVEYKKFRDKFIEALKEILMLSESLLKSENTLNEKFKMRKRNNYISNKLKEILRSSSNVAFVGGFAHIYSLQYMFDKEKDVEIKVQHIWK
jgi:pheromone shutdown protein TraB